MSQIFIANPTLHNRQLHVRVSPHEVRILNIPARGQEMFPDDNLEGAQLDKVIRQIERAGGIPAADPKQIHHRFALLYTVNDVKKPIPTEKINAGVKADEAARQELSGEALEKGTMAAHGAGASVGGQELTVDVTEVNDNGPVEGGANFEITASPKEAAGRPRREERKPRAK